MVRQVVCGVYRNDKVELSRVEELVPLGVVDFESETCETSCINGKRSFLVSLIIDA